MPLPHQTVGNIGMYYTCYRLSLLGWNVMPTARNAKGIDILAYSEDATRTFTVQVKSLSNRSPVPLGKHLDHLFADYVVICRYVVRDKPECFILNPTEVKHMVHKGVKGDVVSYWLQPKHYESEQFRERWDRIGSGVALELEKPPATPITSLPQVTEPTTVVTDSSEQVRSVRCERGVRSEQFRVALTSILTEAHRQGSTHFEISAGQLHRIVGGYPGPNHSMPVCCDTMRSLMQPGDIIVAEPPKGRGASLAIRYSFPRPIL
jgi:hypothetical protein